jgi:type IV fimbrial biogenesis protein FimT
LVQAGDLGNTVKTYNEKQNGLTLIELLIGLVVAAIILSAATPSFVRMIDNNRVTASANEFSASLALAKSEAIKRNRSVKLLAKAGGWNAGYSVGIDLNDDDDFADADELTLKSVDAAHSVVTITPNPNTLTSIEFNMLGGLNDTGSLVFDVDCDEGRAACDRTMTLSSSGVFTLNKETGECACP